MINYLNRREIDINKWDRCIGRSANGTVYACSAFLDHLAINWDAIIVGEYELVMPIVWNRKYGIRYAYTPPFIQQLGVFGDVSDKTLVRALVLRAFEHFSFVDCYINFCPEQVEGEVITRTNYVLSLDKPYDRIWHDYTEECKTNIRKAEKRGCVFSNDIDPEKIIGLYRSVYGGQKKSIRKNDYHNFRNLILELKNRNQLISCGVTDHQTGELLFGALILKSNGRLYYVMAAPSENGRKARAAYFCINEVIRQYSGTPVKFDFEGSDIPGVAAFYQRFNPVNEPYYHLRINKLPWPLRLFK